MMLDVYRATKVGLTHTNAHITHVKVRLTSLSGSEVSLCMMMPKTNVCPCAKGIKRKRSSAVDTIHRADDVSSNSDVRKDAGSSSNSSKRAEVKRSQFRL
jgi:metal-sulfur cluster biosynthetic enzyme